MIAQEHCDNNAVRPEYLRHVELARLLGISRDTLRKIKAQEGFPKPVELHTGNSTISLYKVSDVVDFMEAQRK